MSGQVSMRPLMKTDEFWLGSEAGISKIPIWCKNTYRLRSLICDCHIVVFLCTHPTIGSQLLLFRVVSDRWRLAVSSLIWSTFMALHCLHHARFKVPSVRTISLLQNIPAKFRSASGSARD